jgi:hypothetical protein
MQDGVAAPAEEAAPGEARRERVQSPAVQLEELGGPHRLRPPAHAQRTEAGTLRRLQNL